MKTKRLMVLVPVSFLLYAIVQFIIPLEKVEDQKNVQLLEELPKTKIIENAVSYQRKINLGLLKSQLEKKKLMELYSNSHWRFKLETIRLTTIKPKINHYWNQGNPTIVTALMDIGRGSWDFYRRPYEMYQNFMKPLLALDIHLYVFCDEGGADFVRKHRRHVMNKTVIQIVTLHDLPYYRYFPRMKEILQKEQSYWNNEWEPAMKKHPESFSAEYILLMNSKAYFMQEASARNPFESDHFFWMDAGYGHGQTLYPAPRTRWAPKSLMIGNFDGKVSFMKLRNVDLSRVDFKQLYRKDVALIVGSFFGGTEISLRRYHEIYDKIFLALLKKNNVDDDQTLSVLCYHSNPDLFNFVEGDWYDVFVLFP